MKEGLLQQASPYLDYYAAIDVAHNKLFLILLNDDEVLQTKVQIDYNKVLDKATLQPKTAYAIDARGKRTR